MIIGERKCGTSSLYRYLVSHPRVLPCKVKETHFFSNAPQYVREHFEEYLRFFPDDADSEATGEWIELDESDRIEHSQLRVPIEPDVEYITGEASANVLATVDARLLYEHLPDLKLIVLVRDPVERAFSHFAMHQRYKAEGRKWFWLLRSMRPTFAAEWVVSRLGLDGPYLGPGRYLENIERWLQVYPRPQLMVIRTEDLDDAHTAESVMEQLCEFLELPEHDFGDVLSERFNVSRHKARDEAAAAALRRYYAPHNRALEDFLGRSLDW
jgi:hypothetical protein